MDRITCRSVSAELYAATFFRPELGEGLWEFLVLPIYSKIDPFPEITFLPP